MIVQLIRHETLSVSFKQLPTALFVRPTSTTECISHIQSSDLLLYALWGTNTLCILLHIELHDYLIVQGSSWALLSPPHSKFPLK